MLPHLILFGLCKRFELLSSESDTKALYLSALMIQLGNDTFISISKEASVLCTAVLKELAIMTEGL